MRTNKQLIITLTTCVLLLVASIFCMNVYAANEVDDVPEVVSTQTVVSGCDLKKEDLQMAKVGIAGFSILAPKGVVLSVESDPEAFSQSDLDRSTLIDQNVFFYSNTDKTNYCMVYAGINTLNPLEKCYGNYASLSKAQQDELISHQISSGDTTSKGSFEKINGRTYMMISNTEQDGTTGNQYVVYGLYTVVGNYKYYVQVVAVNPNKNDLQVVNEILNSIKITGIKEPASVLDITLIVCVIVLLLAVGFALFTLYRIDRFVKTGTELKSVLGFDLPAVPVSEDDSDNDDDDSDDDGFDDDAVETEEDKASDSDSEKIIDE